MTVTTCKVCGQMVDLDSDGQPRVHYLSSLFGGGRCPGSTRWPVLRETVRPSRVRP